MLLRIKVLRWAGVALAWTFYAPVLLALITPMVIPFAGVGLLYLIWLPLRASPELSWIVRGRLMLDGFGWQMIQVVAPILIAVGVVVTVLGFTQILRARLRKAGIITSGLYSVVRHPQFLGIGLWTLGFTLYGLRLIDFVAWFTLMFLHVLIAESEERKLRNQFRETYASYASRVPFMIPHPRLRSREIRILPASGPMRIWIQLALFVVSVAAFLIMLQPFVMLLK